MLEEHGILPNYTLVDDAVSLDVEPQLDRPRHRRPTSRPSRPSTAAPRSRCATWRPGRRSTPTATRSSSTPSSSAPTARTCTGGPSARRAGTPSGAPTAPAPAACPRCGDTGIADVSQTLEVVEMASVSSAMRREEAVIDDGRDERQRSRLPDRHRRRRRRAPQRVVRRRLPVRGQAPGRHDDPLDEPRDAPASPAPARAGWPGTSTSRRCSGSARAAARSTPAPGATPRPSTGPGARSATPPTRTSARSPCRGP